MRKAERTLVFANLIIWKALILQYLAFAKPLEENLLSSEAWRAIGRLEAVQSLTTIVNNLGTYQSVFSRLWNLFKHLSQPLERHRSTLYLDEIFGEP
ncbi:hypothetical protein AVEN_47156-1 [Araneus ventricosus]|uniref:Uncharacterized protein n=1 Tax=Araneus ventricosus TaxID=182803 RepID=A0A4Y2ME02_ARAVE|nr:hypothetical protein AVEN_47156-1 [Araneus ventricosus]